ncbi:MAG: tetratricopeptide repeat protein [Weeksellaceae bacterium]
MKKIILSIAMASIFIGVSAQKAEIQATQQAFKSKDYQTALQQADIAESKLSEDPTIEPEDLANFYFAAAKSAKQSGDLIKAGEYYAKLGDLESKPYFKVKNKDTRNWEFFYDEKSVDAKTSAGNYAKVKEGQISKSLLQPEIQTLNTEAAAALKKANDGFNAKDYKLAGDEFTKAYYLYKAIGQDRPVFYYYAGLGYVQTEEYEKAADIFQTLIDNGFTGVETSYIATDKEGNDLSFSTQADMDTQVKLGLVENPRTETSESLEEDLYSNATYTYYQLKNFDKAVEVGQKGLEKFPQNENMNKIITASYQQSGNSDKFVASLQEKVDNGTADAVDYFNLAKTLEDQDDSNADQARTYYEKAIEKDPNFADAHLNLAFLIIEPEKDLVAKMNENLGSSAKEKKIYNENKAKRKALYKEALPYLEKAYEQNPENPSLIKILKNSYEVVGDDDKYTEFKAKYDALVQQ